MTVPEIIRDLRALGPQDLNVVLAFLSARVHQARIGPGKGRRLCDAMDMQQWLDDLAEEWRR